MNALTKVAGAARWAPVFAWQWATRAGAERRGRHLIVAIADHFEPSILPGTHNEHAPKAVQRQRLERWIARYPEVHDAFRDTAGRPLVHTFFSPAEQYDAELLEMLAAHCRDGWGEVEIHLHHGLEAPDTAAATRAVLSEFRDRLVGHGCLSRWEGVGPARYAFVHGNNALANSSGGLNCGVDDEMAVLAETGCYGEFTFATAPNRSQHARINELYECREPLTRRGAFRRGMRLRVGRPPTVFPLMMQGPLSLEFSRGPRPYIDKGQITPLTPVNASRIRMWHRLGVGVEGRPDWVFVKLHCHGMDPIDDAAMLGPMRTRMLEALRDYAAATGVRLHYVTAREMTNIALAATDGREGDPSDYRDYRLRRITPARN